MGNLKNIFIGIGLIVLIGLAGFSIFLADKNNYSDKERCRDYMKLNSNLTEGQGQRYYVEDDRCHEYLNTNWGIARWYVNMDEVVENIAKEKVK